MNALLFSECGASMGDIQLHTAVREGNLGQVRDLLNTNSDVNGLMGLHGTPLCAAISSGQNEIIKYLLTLPKCDVNAKDFDGEPPLCLAVRKLNIEAVEWMLAKSECDTNKPDPVSGFAPLCVAIQHDFPVGVEMLIAANCDVNKAGQGGDTPLHVAVKKRALEALKLILKCGRADVNKSNSNGTSPLHLAAACMDTRLLEAILESCTILQEDPGHRLPPNNLLINKVATLTGNTALHIAVQERNAEALILLVEWTTQFNLTNHQSQTPLFLACEANRFDMAETLLKCGADPKIMSSHKSSGNSCSYKRCRAPIHLCVIYGNYLLVTQLSDYGADLNTQDDNGETPLHYALSRNKLDIATYLLTEGVSRGVDVNITDIHGNTPLFFVSQCMQARTLTQKLLKLGCDVSHQNARGKMALHAAMEMDCSEVVEVLLDNGAPVNAVSDGYTLLHLCALDDLADMARVLLFYGCDMYAKTPEGDRVLRLALEHNSYDMVQLLLLVGYNVSCELFLADPDNLPFALLDDEALRDHIFALSGTPNRLMVQCRHAVRQYFKEHSLRMKTMRHLPLPKRLKDFTLLKVYWFWNMLL